MSCRELCQNGAVCTGAVAPTGPNPVPVFKEDWALQETFAAELEPPSPSPEGGFRCRGWKPKRS